MRKILLTALSGALLAGCGGGGASPEAKELLDEAFAAPIDSAVVSADIEIKLEGIDQLDDPIRLRLTGPYSSGKDETIPAFDWDLSFSGGGQTIAAGLVSTRENVFVGFQGTNYEVGEEAVANFNKQIAQVDDQQGERSLAQFGVDPSEWLSEAEDEGEETVAGVETTHVSAKLDVGRMLDDLNELIDRAGNTVPGQPPPKLTEEQQQQVEEVVEDPAFDVYVGTGDKKIRRLSANLDLEVPEEDRAGVGGLEGGTISFSVEFADVGAKQSIKAPRDSRPIQELSSQLGGLGAFGGGGAAPGGAAPGGAAPGGAAPGGAAPEAGGSPEAGGGAPGERPSGDSFQRYSQCLEEADPSKIEEIQRCSELLQ